MLGSEEQAFEKRLALRMAVIISDDEMDRIVEKFKTYGHQIKEQK